MNPGTSPLKGAAALTDIRRQLEATLDTPTEVRAPRTPPNSPVARRRDRLQARRTESSAPRPVQNSSISSGASVLGLLMNELGGKDTVPEAPPPPPPLPSSASASAARQPPTPAEIMGSAANRDKSPADKMKLFASRAAHPMIDTMAGDGTYAAAFAALAADAPRNLGDIVHQMVAVERLLDNAGTVAAGIDRGIPQGEMAAGRFAGYQVHPHTYAGGGDVGAKTTSLQQQFTRDADAIKRAFTDADAAGDRGAFYGAFTPKGDASCHAVRMNGVMRALEDLNREVDDPFDGSRADHSSEVLQAAYGLAVERGGATEANVRAALGARGVAPGRIDTIVANLDAASLLD